MFSKDFKRFYESCFGDSFGALHSGVDEEALLKLQDDERKDAERMLLQAIGTDKDSYSRPVIALGLLGSKEAAEPLKQRLESASGTDRIQTALALFRIEKYPEAEKIIIDSLRVTDTNNLDESTRWLAVVVSPYLGRTPQIVQSLLEVMGENDNMISNAAVTSLRTLFIDDEVVRDLLAQILLNRHDVHGPNFVPRPKLVQQAVGMINSRLPE